MGVSSPEDQRFAKLWDDAVQQYLGITGKDLRDHSIPKPESVEELIESVTKQHAEFAAFRERGTKLRKCLKDALTPIKLVGNLAAGGASMAFPPSQCIFGAVMYLIRAAENVGTYYDAIVALFSRVEDFTMRLKIYAEQEIPEGLRAILTEILATLLKLLALSAKQLYLGSRVRKYLEFTLLGRDDKIDDAIAQLDRLTRSEQLMTNAEILSQVTRTGKAIGRIEDAVNRHEASQAKSLEYVCEQKVKDTLRPEICTFDTFIEAKDELLKDSGQWIWHEPVFLDWVDRKKPLLWIYGFPGSGKSFLSCSIIQSLERRFPQCVQDASRVSVTYFFCKDDNPKLKSFNTLLRTVSYQIAKNDLAYAKYVAGLCTLLEDGTSMATLWKRLFVEFFLEKESRSCVFLVIDGLDEAYEDERQIFFRLLKGLVKDHGTCRLNIQVLLVGRHHITEEIEEALGVLPLRLAISASKNSKDIERSVRESVRSSVKLRRLPKSLRKEIVDALSNGANGFFLWAKLMLKEVQSRYHHPSQIRSTLSNLPRGLTSTFQLVVDRFSKTLPDQDIEGLNHILAWVICASKPLTLQKLDQSLRIRPSSDQEVFDLEGMIRRYGSFFSLTNYEGTSTEEGSKARSLTLDDELEMHERDIVIDDIENNKHDSSEDSLSGVESRNIEKETPTPLPRLLIRLSHASIGDFFRVRDKCARQWLKCGDTDWCDEFEFLDGYLVRAQEPATKLAKGAFHIEKLSAERIIELASWAGFEESAWWLSRVAYMLDQTGSIDESIAYYERAIALDPEHGIALSGLGVAYSVKRQYRKAIETTLRSQKFLTSSSTDMREASSFNLHRYLRSQSFCQLAHYYEKLGDVDSAIESYKAAIEDLTQPRVGHYFAYYLSLLLRHGKYQQALEVVERVTSTKEMEMEGDLWGDAKDDEFYDELNKAMSILALRTGHCEVIQAFYRKGLEASLRWSIDGVDSAFRFYYAMVLLHISVDETKAIRMLETVVEDPWIALNSKRFHVFKRRAEMELAKIYLKKRLEARSLQDSYEADCFGEKLLKCESGSGNTRRPELIACVWHRLHFREDTAKQCVRALVLLAIDLLTDDTDENDYKGWSNLADSLTAFGDLANAIAALSISKEMLLGHSHAAKAEEKPGDSMKMCQTLEQACPHDESTIPEPCDSSGNANNVAVRTEKFSVSPPDADSDAAATAAASGNSNRSDEQQIRTDKGVKVDHDDIALEDAVSGVDLPFYLSLCDGTCYKGIRAVEGHYMCTYCLEVKLCKDCYWLLMSDKLGLNICGKDHEFLYVPPAEGLYEKGMIKVGGEFVKTQTWLEALKAEWADNHS